MLLLNTHPRQQRRRLPDGCLAIEFIFAVELLRCVSCLYLNAILCFLPFLLLALLFLPLVYDRHKSFLRDA